LPVTYTSYLCREAITSDEGNKNLLKKGEIEEVQPGQDNFISQLFLVKEVDSDQW